jgi:hypothetical protein
MRSFLMTRETTNNNIIIMRRSKTAAEARNICVDKGGVIVVTEGKLNINKLVTKALAI